MERGDDGVEGGGEWRWGSRGERNNQVMWWHSGGSHPAAPGVPCPEVEEARTGTYVFFLFFLFFSLCMWAGQGGYNDPCVRVERVCTARSVCVCVFSLESIIFSKQK